MVNVRLQEGAPAVIYYVHNYLSLLSFALFLALLRPHRLTALTVSRLADAFMKLKLIQTDMIWPKERKENTWKIKMNGKNQRTIGQFTSLNSLFYDFNFKLPEPSIIIAWQGFKYAGCMRAWKIAFSFLINICNNKKNFSIAVGRGNLAGVQ